ncbi:MAG: hypothetical protein QME05_05225 [Candidatus Margulisbacteria bacterium]|nr:hypothetical protein [Candidatus Margulisiibacteriota bacterium]
MSTLLIRRAAERPNAIIHRLPAGFAWGVKRVSQYVREQAVRVIIVRPDGIRIGSANGVKIPWSRWCATRLLELGIREIRSDNNRTISNIIALLPFVHSKEALINQLGGNAVFVDSTLAGLHRLISHPLATTQELLSIINNPASALDNLRIMAFDKLARSSSFKLSSLSDAALLSIFDRIGSARYDELACLMLQRLRGRESGGEDCIAIIQKLGQTSNSEFSQAIDEYRIREAEHQARQARFTRANSPSSSSISDSSTGSDDDPGGSTPTHIAEIPGRW